MQIAIIGAGAAGCFAAIHLKQRLPHAQVTVYESQRRALAKVALTGGGRCNLTNSFAAVKSLETVYPRGARLMKRLMREFDHRDAFAWFEKQGVKLVVQEDDCVFPQSQSAMQVVNTLLRLMEENGVILKTSHRVAAIESLLPDEENADNATHHPAANNAETLTQKKPAQSTALSLPANATAAKSARPRYRIGFTDAACRPVQADAVIITTGGSPRPAGLDFMRPLQLETVPPVPALFSLCLPGHPITQLTGTVVEDVTASLAGTKHKANGPLLITHRGLSGPAILKLTSHAARTLAEKGYMATVSLNWFGSENESRVLEILAELIQRHPQKQLHSVYPTRFNSRLWAYLLGQCALRPEQRWAELGRKSLNRMAATLTNHPLQVSGKDPYKEEFVTCGGVSLTSLNASTLECRKHPGIYLAGEVTDVDAVTGGFNLQAAWTMGYVAAKSVATAFAGPQPTQGGM